MLPDDTRVDDDATSATLVGGIYVIRLSDTHYYGGRTGNFKRRWADHLRELREGRHNNRRMQRVFDIHGRFDPDVVRVLSPDECVDAESDQPTRGVRTGRSGVPASRRTGRSPRCPSPA